MRSDVSRREFIAGLGLLAAAKGNLSATPFPSSSSSEAPRLGKSPFKIAVINDEISQDFGHACEIASQKFGMQWMELRSMWNKNVANLDANELSEAQRILKKNNLRVTDIGSPLFKVDFAGAPKSKFSPEHDQFGANFTYDQQGEVLDRAIELARKFSTDRIRCFDFWRLDDQGPYRKAMNDQLQQAAEKLRKIGLILILENEFACNTATGAESAKVLSGVPSPAFMLTGIPATRPCSARPHIPTVTISCPKPHRSLPLQRRDQNGQGCGMGAMGKGMIDWVGQYKALKRDGYHHVVSLETHWRGAGTPEASTIESWAGMKGALEKAGAL